MKLNKILQLMQQNATQQRPPLSLVRSEDKAEATLYIYDVIDPWWGVSAGGLPSQDIRIGGAADSFFLT